MVIQVSYKGMRFSIVTGTMSRPSEGIGTGGVSGVGIGGEDKRRNNEVLHRDK